jgi:hypothetical protein
LSCVQMYCTGGIRCDMFDSPRTLNCRYRILCGACQDGERPTCNSPTLNVLAATQMYCTGGIRCDVWCASCFYPSCQQLLLFLVCVQMYCTRGIRCDVYSAFTCLIAIVRFGCCQMHCTGGIRCMVLGSHHMHDCYCCLFCADVLHGWHPL